MTAPSADDRREIEECLYRYAWMVDQRKWELMDSVFTADGTIEAAEVRDGDACPSCGHDLEAARGIEMGHIFQLGTKYAEALDLKVLDEHGKLRTVTMPEIPMAGSRASVVPVPAKSPLREWAEPAIR